MLTTPVEKRRHGQGPECPGAGVWRRARRHEQAGRVPTRRQLEAAHERRQVRQRGGGEGGRGEGDGVGVVWRQEISRLLRGHCCISY